MAVLAAIGAAGGFAFQLCGGVGRIIEAYRGSTTWRETHRTIAPAFARGIDKIFDAAAGVITNTKNECSRVTGKALEIVTFGALQYMISASYPASCKDRPDHWVCTGNDIIQLTTTGFFAAASIYAVVQMVSSSKTNEESSVRTISINGTQQSNLTLKELIAKQKAALGKA